MHHTTNITYPNLYISGIWEQTNGPNKELKSK